MLDKINKCNYNSNIYAKYIFLGLLIVISFSYLYWNASNDNIIKLNTYLQVMTLAIFVVNVIISLENFKIQLEDRKRTMSSQYMTLAQLCMNEIHKLFFSNPNLTRMYLQMYGNDSLELKKFNKKVKLDDNLEVIKAEHLASSMIYKTMAEIYTSTIALNEYYNDNIEWIILFRRWLKSKILRSHWTYFRNEHHPKFICFVENTLLEKKICSITSVPKKEKIFMNTKTHTRVIENSKIVKPQKWKLRQLIIGGNDGTPLK